MFKIIAFFILFIPLLSQAEMTFPKQSIGASAGLYSVKSELASLNGLGYFELTYTYRLNPKWSLQASGNNTLKTNLGGLIWGFDLGANYCLKNCYAEQEKIGDDLTIYQFKKYGHEVGFGTGQRIFQLVSTSLSYSGLYVKYDAYKYISPRLKFIGRTQYSMLSNATKTVTFITLSVGLVQDF